MRRLISIMTCSLLVLSMWGCYYRGADDTDDLDLVYTNYDEEYDFSSGTTFAMPDNIIKIDDSDFEEGELVFVDAEYANVILDQIRTNMTSRGYQEVDAGSNPDAVLLVSVNTTTNLFYYYDWAYWGWYYPGYSPGWGWYYPGYYPATVSGYRAGSVFMQLTDPNRIVNDNVPVTWNCIINGLLEGDTENIDARLTNTVDQAFAQSPYLTVQQNQSEEEN